MRREGAAAAGPILSTARGQDDRNQDLLRSDPELVLEQHLGLGAVSQRTAEQKPQSIDDPTRWRSAADRRQALIVAF